MGLADEIAKLQQLKEAGALTEEEFQAAKRKLLSEDTEGYADPPAAPSSARAVVHDIIGEVVDEPNTLGQAANRYVDYKNTSNVFGFIIAIVFIIIFLIFFFSMKSSFDSHFNSSPFSGQSSPHFPQGW